VKSNETKNYYEGFILDLEGTRLLVRYKIKEKVIEEWVEKDSSRIAQVGKYSGKFDPNLHTPQEINNYLYRKKKFFISTVNAEEKFREEIKQIQPNGLKVHDIQGDGNCLYRAISDQVYGNENFFESLKAKCLDYLELERDFFGQFIEGGVEKFDDYIKMKKVEGVWGDDIEIQAMSEIYNRPVEIYSYSSVPIKTFHENSLSYARYDREFNTLPPIRLSYHGKAHYNSIVSVDNNVFKLSLLNFQAGVYEDKVLEKVKLKQLQAKDDISTQDESKKEVVKKIVKDKENEKVAFSRGSFIESGLMDIDSYLEKKFAGEIIDKNEMKAVFTENELIYKQHENEILKKTLVQSKQEHKNETNLSANYGVQFIIDMGFTMEEAIMAFSAVGDDPDLMLQYLYSLNI